MRQRGRQRGGMEGTVWGTFPKGWAGSTFGWYYCEVMGIFPGPAKQSVMFSLTAGDCQQSGAAGTKGV